MTPDNSLPLFSRAQVYGTDLTDADGKRIRGALERVYNIMIDGQQRTLDELGRLAKCPAASAHRHLSTLRTQFGFAVVKERIVRDGGVWLYQIAGGGFGEHTRQPKKMKPIGDPVLFGQMMRAIYAHGNTAYNTPMWCETRDAVNAAASAWAINFAGRVEAADLKDA